MGLKVAILGTTPTRANAPYEERNEDGSYAWEIWASAWATLPRWDRWFEHHVEGVFINPDAHENHKNLWLWLTGRMENSPSPMPDGTKPVYMRRHYPEVAGSIPYPRERVFEKNGGSLIGSWGLTSTISQEIALAITLGAEEIGLYGIEMGAEGEYQEQKPGCQHWIAIAQARGIKISAPIGCEIFTPTPLYALDDSDWLVNKLASRIATFRKLQTDANDLADNLKAKLTGVNAQQNKLDGAISWGVEMMNNLVPGTREIL